jgi:UDP-glucose 4-epimerase
MPTYLVTGGCGFIGSHLVEALIRKGDRVRVIDDLSTGKRENLPSGIELLVGDVADSDIVAQGMAGVDACFHLAAIASVQRSNEDWIGTHRANLVGTIQIFDAARERRIPVVYASSAAIYGVQTVMPIVETVRPDPLTAYGADKLGCELHAKVAGLVHGVPTLGCRFFNVYGPRQDPRSPYSGVISIFTDRIARGEPVTIHGDGRQERDFIYVGDVVRCLIAGLSASSTTAPVVNVCTGRATTVVQLAEMIGNVCGTPAHLEYGPARAGDIRSSLGDPNRAETLLGIRPDVSLDVGLSQTIRSLAL